MTSIIYVSRTGIVLNIILFLWLILQKDDKIIESKEKIKPRKRFLKYVLLAIFAFIIMYKIGMLDYILTRMLESGSSNDNGVNGRLDMWIHLWEAFKSNPMGYGLGNTIIYIQYFANQTFNVGNVHNIYFQMFLDCGLIGGFYFLGLIIAFLKKNIKNFLKDPFIAFIISYLIAGLIQFRGGDAILYFVIGIYFALLNLNYVKGEKN